MVWVWLLIQTESISKEQNLNKKVEVEVEVEGIDVLVDRRLLFTENQLTKSYNHMKFRRFLYLVLLQP